MGGKDVAWGTKVCCRVLVAARLLDGDALAGPSGDPTRSDPWLFCSGGVLGSLICPNCD
jgi:hypothetical protein